MLLAKNIDMVSVTGDGLKNVMLQLQHGCKKQTEETKTTPCQGEVNSGNMPYTHTHTPYDMANAMLF